MTTGSISRIVAAMSEKSRITKHKSSLLAIEFGEAEIEVFVGFDGELKLSIDEGWMSGDVAVVKVTAAQLREIGAAMVKAASELEENEASHGK
jgi:phosphoribosylpyrophosphate synthetase